MKKHFIFAVYVVFLALSGCTEAPQQSQQSQAAEAAQAAKSDKDMFLSYYKDLMAKTADADLIYKPFVDSLQEGDVMSATQVALQIKRPINSDWSKIDGLEVPSLDNQEAKKKLDEAHEALSNCYMYKSTVVTDFIDYADSPSIKKMANLKNEVAAVQIYMTQGMAALLEAADKLGIKPQELDTMKNK